MTKRQMQSRPAMDYDQLVDEHVELREKLREMHDALMMRQLSAAGMSQRMAQLRAHIRQHFRHEEQGGYFAEVVAQAPRFNVKVQELLQQHATFLAELKTLVQLADHSDGSNRWWDEMTNRFDDFVCKYLGHERAEIKLVQEAFCRDIGAGE